MTETFGTTWHVPGNCLTIQAALDSLNDSDTVLVAVGIYHESLHAPNLSFVWLGEVDSAGTPDRPVVDPSPLEGSTHLACLTLPSQSRAVIENLIFRNGPEMFPREDAEVGGIQDSALDLVVRGCTFDSTYKGLYLDAETVGTLTVFDCDFVDNVECCLGDRNASPASVIHSGFSGTTGRMGWFLDSTLIDHCVFQLPVQGAEAFWLMGTGNTVRHCTFGPTIVPVWDIIWTGSSQGCVFENNTFHDIQVTGATVMFNPVGSTDASYFRGNLFENCRGTGAQNAGGGLHLYNQGYPASSSVVVDQCTFDSCGAWFSDGFGSINAALMDIVIMNCSFDGHIGPARAVWVLQGQNSITPSMQDCYFENTGIALVTNLSMHAEMNWWGDNTGPYHAEFNPEGQGDEIVGPVFFVPWLLDSTENAIDPRSPLPRSCQLEVFPNPFNATAVIRFVVDQPGTYNVDLYNTLGQHVKELWSGQVTSEQHISVNTDALASGIYFACVRQSADNQRLALTKMLLLK